MAPGRRLGDEAEQGGDQGELDEEGSEEHHIPAHLMSNFPLTTAMPGQIARRTVWHNGFRQPSRGRVQGNIGHTAVGFMFF